MALITCPECEHQVSSKAASCPHCGAPVGYSAVAGTPVITTQATSKPLKKHALLSALLFWISLVWFIFSVAIVASDAAEGTTLIIPALLTFVGALWGIITKIKIWWQHK